jgi:hypothetical protein
MANEEEQANPEGRLGGPEELRQDPIVERLVCLDLGLVSGWCQLLPESRRSRFGCVTCS